MKPLPPFGDEFLTLHTGVDGSRRTWLSYRTALGAFWEYRLTLPDPTRYDAGTLVGFFEFMDRAKKSSDTKRLYLSVARTFLLYLEADGRLPDVPVATMRNVQALKISNKRLRRNRRHASDWAYVALEIAQQEAGRQPPPDLPEERRTQLRLIALRDVAILCLLLSTAARVSELCALNRGDVQHGRSSVVKVTGKGEKSRNVVVDKDSQRAIQAYLRARTDTSQALFITHPNGQPRRIDPKTAQRILERLEAQIRERYPDHPEAQVVRLTPHILRHNVGTTLAKEGARVKTIKEYLGHASIDTTEVYMEDAADEQLLDDVLTYTPKRRDQIADAKSRLFLEGTAETKDD